MLAQLSDVRKALPVGSYRISIQMSEPSYKVCGSRIIGQGWTTVEYDVRFRSKGDSASLLRVEEEVGGQLKRRGWEQVLHSWVLGPNAAGVETVGIAWTKRLLNGHRASATLLGSVDWGRRIASATRTGSRGQVVLWMLRALAPASGPDRKCVSGL